MFVVSQLYFDNKRHLIISQTILFKQTSEMYFWALYLLLPNIYCLQVNREVAQLGENLVDTRISNQKRLVMFGYPTTGKSTLANILLGVPWHGINSRGEQSTCYRTSQHYYYPTLECCYETHFLFALPDMPVISIHDLPGIPGKHTNKINHYLSNVLTWADFIIVTIPAEDRNLQKTMPVLRYLQKYSSFNRIGMGNVLVVVTFWSDTVMAESERIHSHNTSSESFKQTINQTLCEMLFSCDIERIYFMDSKAFAYYLQPHEKLSVASENLEAEKTRFGKYIEQNNPSPVCFNTECMFFNRTSAESLLLRNEVTKYLFRYYKPNELPGFTWRQKGIGRPFPIHRSPAEEHSLESKLSLQYRQWYCKVEFCWDVERYFAVVAIVIGFILLTTLLACCCCCFGKKCKPLKIKNCCSCERKKNDKKHVKYTVKAKQEKLYWIPEGLEINDSGCCSIEENEIQ